MYSEEKYRIQVLKEAADDLDYDLVTLDLINDKEIEEFIDSNILNRNQDIDDHYRYYADCTHALLKRSAEVFLPNPFKNQ